VVATSRSSERVEATAEKLRARGATTVERTCDVTAPDSVAALRDATVEALGGVDVLVTSAGAVSRDRLVDTTEADWDRVIDVRLDGIYRAIREFAPAIGEGSIVVITSITAELGLSRLPAYTAAKGGADALVRAATNELAPDIRVNALEPGFFITELNRETYAEGTERRRRIDRRAAMGRVGQTAELVGAAVYLGSDAASYTTGTALRVDGGFSDSAF